MMQMFNAQFTNTLMWPACNAGTNANFKCYI